MSASDEEFDNYLDEQVTRQERVTIRRVVRDFQNPFEYYNEVEFKQRYRFRKETVLKVLMPLITHNLEKLTKRGLPIPPVYQLLIALRFYASASFQIISGDLISVSQPTVSRIVKKMSYLISLQIKRYIKFPENSEYTKLKFYQIAVSWSKRMHRLHTCCYLKPNNLKLAPKPTNQNAESCPMHSPREEILKCCL